MYALCLDYEDQVHRSFHPAEATVNTELYRFHAGSLGPSEEWIWTLSIACKRGTAIVIRSYATSRRRFSLSILDFWEPSWCWGF